MAEYLIQDTTLARLADATRTMKNITGNMTPDEMASELEAVTPLSGQTFTPGTADQTIDSGQYLVGEQIIKGDANLLPENIKSGISIFGVEGTLEAGSESSALDALFAIEHPDNGSTEFFPFVTGMTWREYYDSPFVGAVADETGMMVAKICEAGSGDPGYGYISHEFTTAMTYPITDSDGNTVDWDDVIQPVDLETMGPIYQTA